MSVAESLALNLSIQSPSNELKLTKPSRRLFNAEKKFNLQMKTAPRPNLTNCVVWLDSTVGIVADGSDKVNLWQDQSGNNNHFTESPLYNNPPTVMQNGINGLPYAYFNSSSLVLEDNISMDFHTNGLLYSAFAISFNNTGTQVFFSDRDAYLDNVTYEHVFYGGHWGRIRDNRGVQVTADSGSTMSANTLYIIEAVRDQISMNVYSNGILAGTVNNSYGIIDQIRKWYIGRRGEQGSYGGYPANMNFYEMLLYNDYNSNNRAETLSYLKWKYNIN